MKERIEHTQRNSLLHETGKKEKRKRNCVNPLSFKEIEQIKCSPRFRKSTKYVIHSDVNTTTESKHWKYQPAQYCRIDT